MRLAHILQELHQILLVLCGMWNMTEHNASTSDCGSSSAIEPASERFMSSLRDGFATLWDHDAARLHWAVAMLVAAHVVSFAAASALLRYSYGATWLVLISALTAPIGSLYWAINRAEPDANIVDFSLPTWFATGCCGLLLPTLLFYAKAEGAKHATGHTTFLDQLVPPLTPRLFRHRARTLQ